MSNRFIPNFTYDTLRPVQLDFFTELERIWDQYDVIVVVAPTASGKTSLASTILRTHGEGRYLHPNNMLVGQVSETLPNMPALRGQANYRRKSDWVDARNDYRRSPIGLTNYHVHALHMRIRPRDYARELLVIDEAHNLIPFLQDQHCLRFWHHRRDFPWETPTDPEELICWLERLGSRRTKNENTLLSDLTSPHPRFVLDSGEDEWNGGGKLPWGGRCRRGEPETLPQLLLKPIDIRDYPETLWPNPTGKRIVLLSATIGPQDVHTLGLDKRRVAYLECDSPIPVQRRPIHLRPGAPALSHGNEVRHTKWLARDLLQLAEEHGGEKGLVHATYEQAQRLRKLLSGESRFRFHTQSNKGRIWDQFRESDPAEGQILVGCGMWEGLDLVGDLGRWQYVAKIPWLSLGDAAVSTMAEENPDWYRWETLKQLIQGCGRISRTPDDWGVTYIGDGSFSRLQREASHLFPRWWAEAICE